MKPHSSQRGVALIITLVMLSVVTLMALTFLAMSRRQRTSVTITEQETAAQLMADAARARAEAEVVSRMMVQRDLLAYDLIVSTNLINRSGFIPGLISEVNVNYDYRSDGRPLQPADLLLNLANLRLDPRPPVFVAGRDPRLPPDFRFYLDLNRNGRFETNGWLPVVSPFGNSYNVNGYGVSPLAHTAFLSNFFVGDPEWIGVLQHPERPHAADNHMIGRYAFLVAPAGKTLDLNFIHNNARLGTLKSVGYYRDQGFGSWELNLAAFLRDLNTNVWPNYSYLGYAAPIPTLPFTDALDMLAYRYGGNYAYLPSVAALFGARGANAFATDGIDGYLDRPPPLGSVQVFDNDRPQLPWVGADNPRGYFHIEEWFDPTKVPNDPPLPLLTRLQTVQNRRGSYDRYTFYSLLGQLGTDTAPGNQNKIDLNYNNLPPYSATNFVDWQPVTFFTHVAQRLFETSRSTNLYLLGGGRLVLTNYTIGNSIVRTNFSITNISIYPFNEYTPSVHRLLQVAANLYDATTNKVQLSGYPYLPTVFRPVFGVSATNIYISGYIEVTNTLFLNNLRPLDLTLPRDRAALAANPYAVVYNIPFIIGAKKGFPNFNEFSLLNVVQVSRKLEVRKATPTAPYPSQTNQMYMLSITNQFGLEAWNSYLQPFRRPLHLQVVGSVSEALTTSVTNLYNMPVTVLLATNVPYYTYTNLVVWPANQLVVPLLQPTYFVPESVYRPLPRPTFQPSVTNDFFQQGLGYYTPDWALIVTNRFYYALVDESVRPPRLVDFVCMGNMQSRMYISQQITGVAQTPPSLGAAAEPPNVWITNGINGSTSLQTPTVGILSQMDIALGNTPVSDQQWTSYSQLPASGLDKVKAIDLLRMFVGLSPLVYNTPSQMRQLRAELLGKVAIQAGYTPTRKLYQVASWQVNDPLVHYTVNDLLDPQDYPDDPWRLRKVRFAVPPQIPITNSNLGFINQRYRPWGGNPNVSNDPLAYDARVKDPSITRSDNWDFPASKFPSIGWIGRVHRGTPWQTVYLKSALIDTNLWFRWCGSYGTHPTNDWPLANVLTVAPNDNAARGLLSVNQTNLAAWSAVLSGIMVMSNTLPVTLARTNNGVAPFQPWLIQPDAQPNSLQLRTIVAGINRTRSFEPTGFFESLGRILATPELTFASPFINTNHLVTDAMMEQIPQRILSLIREDQPRFVVYAFGQALQPAPNSLYLGAGPYNRMCTNYQITAETASKTVIRVDGSVLNPHLVVESYNELPSF